MNEHWYKSTDLSCAARGQPCKFGALPVLATISHLWMSACNTRFKVCCGVALTYRMQHTVERNPVLLHFDDLQVKVSEKQSVS